jgi:hypothetical protein
VRRKVQQASTLRIVETIRTVQHVRVARTNLLDAHGVACKGLGELGVIRWPPRRGVLELLSEHPSQRVADLADQWNRLHCPAVGGFSGGSRTDDLRLPALGGLGLRERGARAHRGALIFPICF